jgi:hypothetical protein
MAIFNSYLYVYQRVLLWSPQKWSNYPKSSEVYGGFLGEVPQPPAGMESPEHLLKAC